MKKILVIGSGGRVGSALVSKLADMDYSVLAGSRHENNVISTENVSLIAFDLLWDVDRMVETMKGNIDAVYFVAGSKGKNLLQIDLHGAVKSIQSAEKAGISRFILLSSVFALEPIHWNESFLKDITDYNIAKHYADQYLTTRTNLNYTILQPGALKEENGTGKITVDVNEPSSNSIANVVETLVAILEDDSTIGKVIMMHDGETPIKEALKQVK
ncbi:NAD(P)H-binding protein [Dyadobacter sp. CY345]|uniref:NAD(P)H-binding protein n=1 Tax=Dyadobacter sp. CY345 TaxID=2909335 RepID=UPI001F337BE8|nr:NAD(P)H-binding protein [Dyadobacter sp. CY345]MCF2447614.1 NAD(P)H-binding protein [Dyadobacter sp. CY345]